MVNDDINIQASQITSLFLRSGEFTHLSKNGYVRRSVNDVVNINKIIGEFKNITRDTLLRLNNMKHALKKRLLMDGKYIQFRYRDIVGSGQGKRIEMDKSYGLILQSDDVNEVGSWRNDKEYMSMVFSEYGYALNYDSNKVDAIRRNRKRWVKKQKVGSVFDQPLSFYFGQIGRLCENKNNDTLNLLSLIKIGLKSIQDLVYDSPLVHVYDDIIRQFLSKIDDITFINSYNSRYMSQTLTLLHGISTCGGPRSWTSDEIHEQITDWIVGEREKGTPESVEFRRSCIKEFVREWSMGGELLEDKLSFEEYTTDPMRWATSGGAPAIDLAGNKVRSKWAWAINELEHGGNIYSKSKKTNQISMVALKEEKKTRTVITTPLPSYLRQCYILYRFGRAPIRSTMSSPDLVSYLARCKPKWYMSIDASKFDHGVSKSFIKYFFECLRNVEKLDDELRNLIDEELESLDNLEVGFENKIYKYENGLLSGWRMTTLIGSLYSEIVCKYLKAELNFDFDYIVQGDDIILFSGRTLNKDKILECCHNFGLNTNSSKTTCGNFGEFLKYRYSNEEISGYPGRAVRSIFYANPWLDGTIETKPQEVATKWYTLIGRMMVSSNLYMSTQHKKNFFGCMANDINSWSGKNSRIEQVFDALRTPISMGGLAMLENSDLDPIHKHSSYTRMETVYPDEKTKFYSLFVNLKGAVKVERRTITHKQHIDINRAYYKVTRQETISQTAGNPKYDSKTNIFRSILETISSGRTINRIKEILPCLKGAYIDCSPFYPRYLKKTSNWYERMKCLMSTDDQGSPHSCLGSLRYSPWTAKLIHLSTRKYMSNLRSVVPGNSWIAAGYAVRVFHDSRTLLNSP